MRGLFNLLVLQDGNGLFDVLDIAAICDQNRVLHGNDNDILEADTDQFLALMGGPKQAIRTLNRSRGTNKAGASAVCI